MSERSGSRVLPVDVVEEILSRLSVKDVLRCKLLSKSHRTLIKSPSFVCKHLTVHQSSNNNKNKNNIVLVVAKYEYDPAQKVRGFNSMVSLVDSGVVEDVYVPPPANSAYLLTVAGSCNGLLCVLSRRRQERNLLTFLLWNPATRDYTELPATPDLGGNPALGFGHDHVNKDYKLVKISSVDSRFRIELWSMSTNSWKEIDFTDSVSPDLWNFKEYPGVSVKGSLYWLLVSKNYGPPRRVTLVSFNLVNGTFRTITSLPEAAVGDRVDIMDFMGSLAISVTRKVDDNSQFFDVWVMDDDDPEEEDSWTKRFSIGPIPNCVRMRRVSINGKVLMEGNNNRYFFCDPDNNNNEEEQQWQVSDCISSVTPWIFAESLVSGQGNPRSCPDNGGRDELS